MFFSESPTPHTTHTRTCTLRFWRIRSNSTICEQFLFTSTEYQYWNRNVDNRNADVNANTIHIDYNCIHQSHSANWLFGVESWLRNAITRATGQRCDAFISSRKVRTMLEDTAVDNHPYELDRIDGNAFGQWKCGMVQGGEERLMLLSGNSTHRNGQKCRRTIQVSAANSLQTIESIEYSFFYLLYRLSECFHFKGTTVLPSTIEYILVKCKSGNKQLYVNSHAIMRNRSNLQKRLNEFRQQSMMKANQVDNSEEELAEAEKPRPLSVLMLSIDSISRLNLIRAMPKTAQHLYDNKWFELQGYNKVNPLSYSINTH